VDVAALVGGAVAVLGEVVAAFVVLLDAFAGLVGVTAGGVAALADGGVAVLVAWAAFVELAGVALAGVVLAGVEAACTGLFAALVGVGEAVVSEVWADLLGEVGEDATGALADLAGTVVGPWFTTGLFCASGRRTSGVRFSGVASRRTP